MRWFTSDLHLGDPWAAKLRYCGKDVEKMHEQLASRWDSRVSPSDTIWLLGDIVVGWDLKAAREWLEQRPGRKHVVLGNHDDPAKIVQLPISHVVHTAHLNLGGIGIATMDHYPEYTTRHGLLLHGHSHQPRKWSVRPDGQVNLHVGWEAWRRPVSEAELVAAYDEARRSVEEAS